MPDYVPQTWQDGNPAFPVSAARLNFIEQGIDRAYPATVTSLPGTPFDGQMIHYMADAANGVVWPLVYRSASASTHKWEAIGPTPLTSEVLTSEATTSSTYVDLATVGPSVTVPLAGDYLIEFASQVQGPASGSGLVSPKLGAAATSDNDHAAQASSSIIHVSRPIRRNGLAASAVIKLQYRTTLGNSATFARRNLIVWPVRVS